MEDVTLKRRALTLWAASHAAVRMDTREMALPAQVKTDLCTFALLHKKTC